MNLIDTGFTVAGGRRAGAAVDPSNIVVTKEVMPNGQVKISYYPFVTGLQPPPLRVLPICFSLTNLPGTGDYNFDVKIAGKSVPGSPFKVGIQPVYTAPNTHKTLLIVLFSVALLGACINPPILIKFFRAIMRRIRGDNTAEAIVRRAVQNHRMQAAHLSNRNLAMRKGDPAPTLLHPDCDPDNDPFKTSLLHKKPPHRR